MEKGSERHETQKKDNEDEHNQEVEGIENAQEDRNFIINSGNDSPAENSNVTEQQEENTNQSQVEQTEQGEQMEQTKNSEKISEEGEGFFYTRFETNFGITNEQMKEIEGFERLSPGQQKLIYENFVQCTLGGVREEAARLCQEKNEEKRQAFITVTGKVLGRAAAGFREALVGEYQSLKAEKNTLERIRVGGFEEHKEILSQLINSSAHYGPRVHENINGELEVDLVNIRERAKDKEIRKEEWFAMNELNRVAHDFAKVPSEWRGKTLGVDDGSVEKSRVGDFIREKILRQKTELSARERRATYVSLEGRFIQAKKSLEATLKKGGKTDLEVAEIFIGIDSRVNQLQTLQTNPDALTELGNIKNKNLFLETAKGLMTKSGLGYMSLGFASRTVAGSAFGIPAAPIVSGGIASMRSWDRTAAKLRERDRNARGGVKDTGEGALNIVDSQSLKNKIVMLMDRYHNAEDEEKAKLLSSLGVRVRYSHDKMMLNRINYGPRSGSVTEQTRLSEVMGEAFAIIKNDELAQKGEANKRIFELKGRLEKHLKRTEQNIIEARKMYRKEDKIRSIEKAAAFSIAGALIADFFQNKPDGEIAEPESKPTPETAPTTGNVGEVLKETPVADVDAVNKTAPDANAAETQTTKDPSPVESEKEVAETASESETVPPVANEVPTDASAAETQTTKDPSPVESEKEVAETASESETVPPVANEVPTDASAAETQTTKDPSPVESEKEVAETASESETVPSEVLESEYHIEKGDTLIGIIKEQIPEIKNLATSKGQDNAIANILGSLTLEELDRIGIRSGNVDLIYAGESLNLTELNKVIAERQNFLESAARRFGGYVEETDIVTEDAAPPEADSQTGPVEGIGESDELADEVAASTYEGSNILDDEESSIEPETSDSPVEGMENAKESISPYGIESPEIIKFREKETKAFLDYSEKLYNHRMQRIRTGSFALVSSYNNATTEQLRSGFDSYVLSMMKETPSFSLEKGRVLLEGNITAIDRGRAAEYLMENVKNDKTKHGNALKGIIKEVLRNKAYAQSTTQ